MKKKTTALGVTFICSVRSGLPIPEGVPASIQERAWSSPIWYTPEAVKTAKK